MSPRDGGMGDPSRLVSQIEQTNHSKFDPSEWEAWRWKHGLSSDSMPGPVTWLILDGETHASTHSMGLRSTPGAEDDYIPRPPPVDALAWADVHISDPVQKQVFVDAVEMWYPGRQKGVPALVVHKVWTQFQKRIHLINGIWQTCTMTDHRPDFWRIAWLDAIVSDTRLLRASQAYWCGRRTLFGIFVDGEGAGVSATRWRCKSWTCLHCSRYMQSDKGRELGSQMKALYKARQRLTFITLTLDPSKIRALHPGLSSEHYETLSWRIIRQAFKPWIRGMRKVYRFAGPLEYTLRVEAHRSGWAHLHVVIASDGLGAQVKAGERLRPKDRPARQTVRSLAISSGFGRVVDVQRVKSPKAIGVYITKAATRNHAGMQVEAAEAMGHEMSKARQTRSKLIPRNFRTIEKSRGWALLCETVGGWTGEPPPSTGRQYLSVGLSNTEPEQWIDAITAAHGDYQKEIKIYMCAEMGDKHATMESPKQLENLCRRYLEPDDDPPPIPI